MFYAQLDENKICIGISRLSGKIEAENMIEIESYDSSLISKKYINGIWEVIENPKQPELEIKPTEAELIQAEILLAQQAIVAKQKEQDDVLALLLLNQQKG